MLGRGGWCRVSAAWLIRVPLRRTLMRDHGCRPGCVHAARRISGGRVPGPPRAGRAAATVDPHRPPSSASRAVAACAAGAGPANHTDPRARADTPASGHRPAVRTPGPTGVPRRRVTSPAATPGQAARHHFRASLLPSAWCRLGIDLTRPADRTTRRGDRIIDDTGTGDQLLLQANFRQAAPGDDPGQALPPVDLTNTRHPAHMVELTETAAGRRRSTVSPKGRAGARRRNRLENGFRRTAAPVDIKAVPQARKCRVGYLAPGRKAGRSRRDRLETVHDHRDGHLTSSPPGSPAAPRPDSGVARPVQIDPDHAGPAGGEDGTSRRPGVERRWIA
jgi:hypothetical protein